MAMFGYDQLDVLYWAKMKGNGETGRDHRIDMSQQSLKERDWFLLEMTALDNNDASWSQSNEMCLC